MSERTGRVKWFSQAKGFGFIVPDDGEAEIFVHHTSVRQEDRLRLIEGQRVKYQVADSPKGLKADQVVLLDE